MQPLDSSVYDAILQYEQDISPVHKVAQPTPQITKSGFTIRTTRRRNALTDF